MALKHSVLVFITIGFFLGSVEGKGQLCYSCISQGGDETCLLNPAAVQGGVVACKYDYCTIRRLEDPNAPGIVTSFLRGCEGKDNTLPDGENTSPDLVVWAWKCLTDLCNTGNGLQPPTGPGGGGTGDGGLIQVPGSTASSMLLANGAILISLSIMSICIYFRFL